MSKQVQNALRNSFLQTIGAFGITGLNFILMFGYAHILGPARLGTLVTVQAQVLVWTFLVDLGLSNALIGSLTAAESDRSELARQGFRARDLVVRVLGLRFLGACLGCFAIIILTYFDAKKKLWGTDYDYWGKNLAYVPFLFATAFQQTAVAYSNFRGNQALSVLAMIIGTFFAVTMSLIYAIQGKSISVLLLSQSWAGFLTAAVIALFFLYQNRTRHLDISIVRRSFSLRGPWADIAWQALWQDAWPYAITFAAGVLWMRLDQIVTARYLGFEASGQYALAIKLAAVAWLVSSAIAVALFPEWQRLGRDAPEKLLIYLGAIIKLIFRYGIVVAAALAITVGFVITPLFPKFHHAIALLPWFIPGMWAYWLQSFLVAGLFGLRLYRSVVLAHLLSITTYMVCIIPLAKIWGLIGIVMASNIYSFLLFFFCYSTTKKLQLLPHYSLFNEFSLQELDFLMDIRKRILGIGK